MSEEPVRVLIVDDKLADVRNLEDLLDDSPGPLFDVTVAGRLAVATSKLRAQSYDVALLDLSLPDAAGLEGIKVLQEQRPEMAVIALSSEADETLAVRSVQQGAQDFLVKRSLDAAGVARAVTYALERHKRASALAGPSLFDDRTGLHSRDAFLVLAEGRWHLAHRIEKGFSLLLVDLDGFTPFTDKHGEKAAAKALTLVASTLRRTFRTVDVLARLGKDTFAVLALDSSAASDERRSQRLRENFRRELEASDLPQDLTYTAAVVHLEPGEERSIDQLLVEAELALSRQREERSTT